MNKDENLPDEIDFSKGVRGLHQIPAGAKVMMPASIEKASGPFHNRLAALPKVGEPLSDADLYDDNGLPR